MNLPKISVIIATFNCDSTIKGAVESVLIQDYINYELIIVDGGSTDNTVEIIREYQSFFKEKLIIISEPDLGIYDAWNKGLKIAKGTWISFIGGDDYFSVNAFELYVNSILNNPSANFISSKCKLIDSKGNLIRIYGQLFTEKMFDYCVIAHVGSFHHRSLFINNTFNIEYKISSDYDLLIRTFDSINPIFIDIITCTVRDNGISNSNIFRVASEKVLIKYNNKIYSIKGLIIDYCYTIASFWFRKATNFIYWNEN